MYQLVKPEAQWEKQHFEYLRACEQAGDKELTPSAAWVGDCKNYTDFLHMTENRAVEPLDDFVPSTLYYFVDNEQILGMVDFRHYLSDSLRLVGGHIGYSIHPSMRGKGLAPHMLKLAVNEGRRRGLLRLLLTCYKDNTRSALTIMHCGGVLEDEFKLDNSGRMVQRYWIPTGL